MIIEIFEIKGHPDDELDNLIVLLSRSGNQVKKINVLDREAMKSHQDISRLIKTRRLPIIKIDGKVVDKKFLESVAHNF